jgi:MFS family permease
MKRIFRALESRDYRLFFTGQGISILGTTLQQIALGWYVYRITGSEILLGTIGFLNQIPGLVISPFAGTLSDRIDGRFALIAVQSGLMLQAILLALFVSLGIGNVPVLLALAALQGVVNAFDIPLRLSVVPRLASDPALLPSAIALNSAVFNVARIAGPAVGGFMVAALGEESCFWANAASYLAVLWALLAMHGNYRPRPDPERAGVVKEMALGWQYVRSHRPVRDLLLILSCQGLLGMAYMVHFPVLARDVLHGGPHTLGILMGSAGVGSLAAAMRLASRRNLRGLLGNIALNALVSAVALMLFLFVHTLPAAVLLAATAGFGFIAVSSACNTFLNTVVEPRMRGRVMSFYSLSFVATTPIGNLAMGWLAHRIGITAAIASFGAALFLCALVFLLRLEGLRRTVRPIYADLGLIPWQE